MLKSLLIALLAVTSFAVSAHASENEEFNPFDPNAEEILKEYDKIYEQETGESAFPAGRLSEIPALLAGGCYRQTCSVWIVVNKSSQTADLYLNGNHSGQWLVSTGMAGHGTPNFDKHPNGRIYTKYSSTKFPGGDYKGLGNMPFAVFIQGGFALHGTPASNWPRLGHRASHGCVRQHPDNGQYFMNLVKQVGVANVWITIQ